MESDSSHGGYIILVLRSNFICKGIWDLPDTWYAISWWFINHMYTDILLINMLTISCNYHIIGILSSEIEFKTKFKLFLQNPVALFAMHAYYTCVCGFDVCLIKIFLSFNYQSKTLFVLLAGDSHVHVYTLPSSNLIINVKPCCAVCTPCILHFWCK